MTELVIKTAINNNDLPKDHKQLKRIDDQFEMMFGKSMKYLKQKDNNLQKEKRTTVNKNNM